MHGGLARCRARSERIRPSHAEAVDQHGSKFTRLSATNRWCTKSRASAPGIPSVGEDFSRRRRGRSIGCVGVLVGKRSRSVDEANHSPYASGLPELADASGYNDPVTARFVACSEIGIAQKIPITCFERDQARAGGDDRAGDARILVVPLVELA
jgi:hypothetical protein